MNKRQHTARLVCILLILLGVEIFSDGRLLAQHKTYTTARLQGDAPEIDGSVSDKAWESAPWEGNFIQREPYDGKAPTQPTEFKIIYDDEALYVAIRAYDSMPERIDRRLTRRDDLDGDFVGIHIDSYFDRRTAFAFMVNAAGVKSDYTVTSDEDDDYSWDPVWYVKTSVDSLGWIAEMKIPYSQLRFARADNYLWGIEVGRKIFRLRELSLWKAIPKDAAGWVSQFGDLAGISGIKPKKEVELLPYVMGKLEHYEKEEGNPYADGLDLGYNAGIDGKVAVTNDLTLNFTINPDFGQVEADPSVVNLSAFETFYSEKRPFFVEGNSIYDFKLTGGDGTMSLDNLFYSRRIGRAPHYEPETEDSEYIRMPENTSILGAVKLSGKTAGGWSVGIMESVTREEKADFTSEAQGSEVTVEPWTNFFNTRIQKDFNQGQTIVGGMVTATNRFISDSTLEFINHSAYTGGLDFTRYWKDRIYYLRTKAAFSYVAGSEQSITEIQECPVHYYQRPDAPHIRLDTSRTSLAGHGGIIEFGKQGGGHWRYVGWLTWRSPGLELNDMGYLRMADIIQQIAWVGYEFWEPFSIFRSINGGGDVYTGWDFSGQNIYSGIETNVFTQFKNYWGFSSGINIAFETVDRYELRGGPAIRKPGGSTIWFEVSSDTRKKLTGEAGMYNNWGNLNYTRMMDLWIGVNYRPLNALQVSVEPVYSSIYNQLQYVETVRFNNQDEYIMGRIEGDMVMLNFRIDLNITPDLTIQYWGQPFIFAGDYVKFRKATETMAADYHDRFQVYTDQEITLNPEDNIYNIDENHDGMTDYSFDNPDFKVLEFRSNLVIRWEYIPGSTVYVVWSQGRIGDESNGRFKFAEDYTDLFGLKPHNIFQIKFSYRISI